MAKQLTRHPWDRWLSRTRAFVLDRWKDFEGMPHAMAVQVRTAAHKRNLRASIQVQDNRLVITLTREGK